jgi:glycosyltransferase involved in cell wall biosynthesis
MVTTRPSGQLRCTTVHVLVFGTYSVHSHPRVGVLAEGLRRNGATVSECNAPLGIDTAHRVAILRQPWRLPQLALRIARCWLQLARRARRLPQPDVVLVGYLGHFDVLLARRLFRRTPIVLDHLISAADTALDRGEAGGLKQRLLTALDSAALRSADVVVVDTEEHRRLLPDRFRDRAEVVAVGAPDAWFAAARPVGENGAGADGPLRVVFFGLFTPLQGAPVIGKALAELAGEPVDITMIGKGQDHATTRAAAAGNDRVTWLDWVPAADLPKLVADHDVCLGVFGAGPKALRVVPNKVFQGAAAGCAVVTSDSPPQRRVLGDAAVLVPPNDPAALAAALRRLTADRDAVSELRLAAGSLARERFAAGQIVRPLLDRLRTLEPHEEKK